MWSSDLSTKVEEISVQSKNSNTSNLYMLDPSSAHGIIAEIEPGGFFSIKYAGELWCKADSENQTVYLTTTWHT